MSRADYGQDYRSMPERLWMGMARSGVGKTLGGVWERFRYSSLGLSLRRAVWPYRMIQEVGPGHIAAVWGIGFVAWLLGLLVTSGLFPILRIPVMFTWAVVAGAVGVWMVLWYYHYRLSPTQFRHSLLGRDGVAHYLEIKRTVGPGVAKARASVIRPASAARMELEAKDVGIQLGTSRAVGVWVIAEYAIYLVGPARSGKGFGILIAAIVDAPGSVVSTSTRVDNMEATIALRALKGPVFLFDPEGVSGRVNTLRWSPIAGCEDPAVAQRRAQTLVAKTGLDKGDNAVWAGSAAAIVQSLLHAAAVAGKSVNDVYEWSRHPSAATPAINILENPALTKENWAITVEAIKHEDPRLAGSKWFGVEAAFNALAVSRVRNIFNVEMDDPDRFDPTSFLLNSGTLYMVSRWRETDSPSSVGAFFSLILDDIAENARKLSQNPTYGGRLDPPCTMVLDEIANIHPWPSLPRAMSAGSGEGLQVICAFQSRSQARMAYQEYDERMMWESSFKLVLGGGGDKSDSEDLSDILGTHEVIQVNHSTRETGFFGSSMSESRTQQANITTDEVRRFPEKMSLLISGRARPIVVDLIPWVERDWAVWAKASQQWHRAHPGSSEAPGPVLSRDTFATWWSNQNRPAVVQEVDQ